MTSSKKLFSKSGETLLNARKAAGILDCAPDYVSRLCREGKIEGVRHQGQWFIEPRSLALFEAEREAARAARSETLAEERRSESLAFANANSSALERAVRRIAGCIPTVSFSKHAAAALLISMLLGGSVCASSAAFAPVHAAPNGLSASAGRIESPFFSTVSFSFGSIWRAIAGLFVSDSDIAMAPATKIDEKPVQPQSSPAVQPIVSVATTTQTFVTNTYPVIERTIERAVGHAVPADAADLGNFVTYEFLSAQVDSIYRSMSRRGGGGIADFSTLAASDIPSLDYLPLSGGTLSGALSLTSLAASATSTLAGITLDADCTIYNNGGKLTTDASGNIICDNDTAGSGSGAPGGSNGQVQYNDAGDFGGDAGFTYSESADRLTVGYASTTGISTG